MADENSQEDVDSMFDDPPAGDVADDAGDKSQEDVDSMFDDAPNDGTSDDSPDDAAPDEPDGGASDDDYGDLDLDDIDFPDDDFDEDFDDDGEGGGDKKKWIIIGSAVFVLVAMISGGAIFFLGGDEEEIANSEQSDAVLSLAIPPKGKMQSGAKMKMGRTKMATGAAPQPAGQPAPTSRPASGAAPASSASAAAPVAATTASPEASRPRTQAGAGMVIPAVTAAAYKGIPMMQNPKPLPGPDKQLGESIGGGVVPKVAADGRQAWQTYAKPFTGATDIARVGIIIKGLGFSRAATIAAINHTPAEVTLAFDPYAKNVGDWVGLARTAGHETLITLPMEPDDFPTSDPGPLALQTDLQHSENIDRLRYILAVSLGNVGMLQMMGSRFATSQEALTPVLTEIQNRGLLMIDSGLVKGSQIVDIASTIALPRARVDVFIDEDPSHLGILRGLSKLAELAQKNSSAIGMAQPLPSTLTDIMAWTKTLPGKKLVLAPVSAIVKISGSGNDAGNPDQAAEAGQAKPDTTPAQSPAPN